MGIISDTSAYDVNRDVIYGVPAQAWHKMSSSEQRYYAQKWLHSNVDFRRQMDEASKVTKVPGPAFLTNTKLLLTEN